MGKRRQVAIHRVSQLCSPDGFMLGGRDSAGGCSQGAWPLASTLSPTRTEMDPTGPGEATSKYSETCGLVVTQLGA